MSIVSAFAAADPPNCFMNSPSCPVPSMIYYWYGLCFWLIAVSCSSRKCKRQCHQSVDAVGSGSLGPFVGGCVVLAHAMYI